MPDDGNFRDVYEHAPFAYFSVGSHGSIQDVNPYGAELLGGAVEDLVGRHVFSLYAETAAGRVTAEQVYHRFLAGEEIQEEELEMRRADGTSLWVSLTVRPVYDANGRLVASHSIVANINRQKLAEAALHASQTRLAGILNIAPVAIVSIDDGQRINLFNRSAEAIFGYAPAEVLGEDLGLLLPERFRAAHRTYVADFSRGSPKARLMAERSDVHGRRQNGEEFPAEASVASLDLAGKTTSIVALRDLSEQRRAEAEPWQLQEQLLQAQKLEAIGQLAGGVAHDFNNLLTVMFGSLDLALHQLGEHDPCRSDLKEARKAAERAAQLTRQLLAFSRKQILQPALVDLNTLVGGMRRMLGRLIEENIEIVTVLQSELPPVMVDPAQIEQVIVNLAINARDAMPDGGTLTIETAVIELDEAYSRTHRGVASGQYVMLAVSDTGIGMDATTRRRMFEPFFTTKERGKGTGLGLATVYGTVKQSGGHIWVYSEPGQGTIFKIYLPLGGNAPGTAEPLATTAAPAPGSETILVVEDDEAVRGLARQTLERQGYAVLEARDVQDALWHAQHHDGAIHLLLTDVIMPQMDGRELSRQITAARPRIRVLFMSGYADNVIVRRGLLDPGVTLLQKPFTPIELTRRVRAVLDTDAN